LHIGPFHVSELDGDLASDFMKIAPDPLIRKSEGLVDPNPDRPGISDPMQIQWRRVTGRAPMRGVSDPDKAGATGWPVILAQGDWPSWRRQTNHGRPERRARGGQ
jgi:hypothetical protein